MNTSPNVGTKKKDTHLELSSTVGIEGLLVDVVGKSQRIEESCRGDNTKLVLVSHFWTAEVRGALLAGAKAAAELRRAARTVYFIFAVLSVDRKIMSH